MKKEDPKQGAKKPETQAKPAGQPAKPAAPKPGASPSKPMENKPK